MSEGPPPPPPLPPDIVLMQSEPKFSKPQKERECVAGAGSVRLPTEWVCSARETETPEIEENYKVGYLGLLI